MKALLSRSVNPEQRAREAIRKKNWAKAIVVYEQQLKSSERDYALWNLVGDLHLANKSQAQATEAWRRAMEGYALEGLFDSVIGIARKILRCSPSEEDIHLQLAEAYLDLEYFADSLAAFRSYLKMAGHRSEPEMKSYFKRLMECQIRFSHLLDEAQSLLKESGIEDVELAQELASYVERMLSEETAVAEVEEAADEEEPTHGFSGLPQESVSSETESGDAEDPRLGLTMLDSSDGGFSGRGAAIEHTPEPSVPDFDHAPDLSADFETPTENTDSELPAGEGKDHYDLGVVYTEMSLWDAAIAEFDNARRDPSFRHRATLGLANCYQNTNDLQKALSLLEGERKASSSDSDGGAELHFQLGEVYELLGQMEDALQCFEQIRDHTTPRGSAADHIEGIRRKMLQEGGPDESDQS